MIYTNPPDPPFEPSMQKSDNLSKSMIDEAIKRFDEGFEKILEPSNKRGWHITDIKQAETLIEETGNFITTLLTSELQTAITTAREGVVEAIQFQMEHYLINDEKGISFLKEVCDGLLSTLKGNHE